MENTSTFTTFILDGYFILDQQKHLYFTIFLFVYVAIVLLNALLIAVIYTERTLHNPMFILVCHLSVNDIYGSSSLIPHLLFNLATQFYKISLTNCLIQIYCLHTFNIIELTILAVMGYDRYIAICHPLRYHSLMSPRKLQIIVIFMWFYPLITFLCYESLTIRLTFCNEFITKTHCINFELIKLSCTDITVHSIIGLFLTMTVFMLPQMLVILFSYAQILRVCLYSSKECKTKAVQTCTPHLLTVLNYFIGCFFEIIQSRYNISYLPYDFRTFMALYFMIFPPLFNPIIYGMSGRVIRNLVYKFLFHKKVGVLKQ
ncbi:olfactory receptor 1S1-like [Astyanax mexicanus]|uniref:olfactory receptor 1S1-like n=1 Tax=Astyanax mexicanus TaxID=7994 RepID=UPI0020CAE744|nr:olfactory receptor 1S1-like [Astyanax mexicanus]